MTVLNLRPDRRGLHGITRARASELVKKRKLTSDRYAVYWVDETKTPPQIIRTYFDEKLNFTIEVYGARFADGTGLPCN